MKNFLITSIVTIFLSGCVTYVVEKPAVKKPAKSKTYIQCQLKYKQFVALKVDVRNINEILERGLLKSDFNGPVSNEAFQVLAEARNLGCRY